MNQSIYDKVIQALKQAESHNSDLMVRPEVILWPDPESQWLEVIPVLQEKMPQLLVYGIYDPTKKQGPAIWLKCMIAGILPEANWDAGAIPVIYLPGVTKNDLRNVENAVFNFQPLLEYQYTGALFLQENGREWTVMAFVENPVIGLGVKVAKDNATKDALKKTLPAIFQDGEFLAGKAIIDAGYLNNHLFPDIIPAILKWMCKGEAALNSMDAGKKEVFASLCRSQYDFEPDHRNIKAIAEKLGSQKNQWIYVWQLYAMAPHKYPEIEDLLRMAKPADLGIGIFALPEESWPQVNEKKEEALGHALVKAAKLDANSGLGSLIELEKEHGGRRNWVWHELGKSPLAAALQYLLPMAVKSLEPFPSSSLKELKNYYTANGYIIDQNMRKSLASVKSEKDKTAVKSVINLFYRPWLESVTAKYQKWLQTDAAVLSESKPLEETDSFILFVDAFRYELAEEFSKRLAKYKWKVTLEAGWSAIPSLTPTSKPNVSPIVAFVSDRSRCNEFRPQLQDGKDLSTNVFRETLKNNGYGFVSNANDIEENGKYWQEIGDIDAKGHEEQADIVRRVDELFEQVHEALDAAFEKGIRRIRIVTDHGWLLLPGGLPKTQLSAGLTETRWGRCALIKEGAQTDLLHLPWRWNPAVYVAYAPGISFFKANVEYAHGGISLHECLVPVMTVENPVTVLSSAKITEVKWVNLKCNIVTENANDRHTLDIRTKYSDESTSIVESTKKNIRENKGVLMVNEDAESKSVTVVLFDENGRIINRKLTTVGG